jgi:3-hydroxybutyryl-CoA dehydrogenase
MGRRISYGCILGGVDTKLFDSNPRALADAVGAVRRLVDHRVAEGRLAPEAADQAMARLSVAQSLPECVADVQLVIETVPENIALKRAVFAEADRHAPREALIGTNTSSIPGSKLADATTRPAQVFNFNWGTPEHLKVEVMSHPGTAPETMEKAVRFVRSLGLVPIVVTKEILGYASNRVWRAIKKEVLHLIDRGHITPAEIDRAWMLDWGVSMGPCGLMDEIGLDVVRDIELIYFGASGDPSDRPPPLLERMVAEGALGVKAGQGFYTYPDPAYRRPGWLTGESTISPD